MENIGPGGLNKIQACPGGMHLQVCPGGGGRGMFAIVVIFRGVWLNNEMACCNTPKQIGYCSSSMADNSCVDLW